MILFSRRDGYGYPSAAVIGTDGTGETAVRAGLSSYGSAWAPNASAILFEHNGHVVRYRLSTATFRRLTKGRDYDYSPDWQAKAP